MIGRLLLRLLARLAGFEPITATMLDELAAAIAEDAPLILGEVA